MLKKNRITTKLDTTAIAVGRRYARTDELGIPFGITIDYEGVEDSEHKPLPADQLSVTLRERDSTEQVRVKFSELVPLILALLHEETTWAAVKEKYPAVTRPEGDEQ